MPDQDLQWFTEWQNEDPAVGDIQKANESIVQTNPVLPNQRTQEKAAIEASRTDLGGEQFFEPKDFEFKQKLELTDGPYPLTVDAAVRDVAAEGNALRFSSGEYDDISKHSDLLLERGLKQTGLDFLPTNLKVLMQRALTYNMVKYYAPLGDGERQEVLRTSGRKLMDKAMNVLDHRMRELGPAGEDPEPETMQQFSKSRERRRWEMRQKRRRQYEQQFAQLKSWRSRLDGEDPRADLVFRQLYRHYSDWQLEKDRLQRAENANIQTTLDRLGNGQLGDKFDFGNATVLKRGGKPQNLHKAQDSAAELWDALKGALVDTQNKYGPEQALALSLRGSVKQARLRAMGMDEDALNKTGIFGTLMKTHPTLMAEVAQANQKRILKVADDYGKRSGDQLSWEKRENLKVQSLLHTLYSIERIGASDENAALAGLESRAMLGTETTAEMRGKQVDDAQGTLGVAMFNLLGAAHTIGGTAVDWYRGIRNADLSAADLTGKAVQVLTVGLGEKALKKLDDQTGVGEDYGLSRESRLSTEVAHAAEDGEISNETMVRVMGRDSAPTMLMWGIINDLSERGPQKTLTKRLHKWAGMKLHPEAVKDIGDQFREEFVNETVAPPGFESLQDLEDWYVERMNQAGKAIREGRHVEGRSLAFSTALVDQLFTGYWEMGGFLVKEPETVGLLGVAGFFGGKALTKTVGKNIDVGQMAARMTLGTRLRREIKDLIAHDPYYAKQIQGWLKNNSSDLIRKGALSEERLRELDGVLRVFSDDSLLDSNKLANLTNTDANLMRKKRTNPRIHRQLDADLRRIDTLSLEKILDLDHQGAEMLKYLRNPTRLAPVVDFVSDVMERTGYAKRRFNPRIRARAENLLGKIGKMVTGGASLERFKSILFPFSGAVGPDKQSIWARLVRRFPALEKTFSQLDATKTSLLVKGAKFLQESLPTITALRDYNNAMVGRQHRLLRALQNKNAGRMADYGAGRFLNEGDELLPDEAAQLAKMEKTQSRLKEAEGQVLVRDWSHPTRMSKHQDVVENTTVGELRMMLDAEDPMSTHRMWAALRKDGETIDAFEQRWRKLTAQETDFIENGTLPEGYSADQMRRRLRGAKRELLEAGYDQQGLDKVVRTDLTEPDSAGFRPFKETEKLYQERQAVARRAADAEVALSEGRAPTAKQAAAKKLADADPDKYDPMTNFGFEEVHAGREWKELRRWSNSYDAETMAYIREAAPMMDPGDIGSLLAHMQAGGEEARNRFHYFSMRNQRNAEVYMKMSPERRAAFDQAIEKLADGEGRDWADLMRKDKELAASFGEGPEADIVERMWKDNEEMRETLMDWAYHAGMIDEDVHDYFLKYYAPHRYKHFSWRELNPKWQKKAAHEVIEKHPEAVLTDFEEFTRQRDHHRFKVLVKRDGGTWIKRKFDSRDEAVAWAEENVGLRRLGDEPEGDFKVTKQIPSTLDNTIAGRQYRSFMGDEVTILDPLGEDMLDYLRPQPTGENLFERMSKLSRDVSFYNYLKMFDRPGWTVDKRAFDAMHPRMRKQFVEVPSEANGWGPFAGKYLHKRLAKRIQDFTEVDSALKAMKVDMTRVVQEAWTSTPMIWAHKALSGLAGTARFFKTLIANNRVMRNPRTIMGNVLWDKQKTARVVDPMYLYDPIARESEREAYRALLGANGWLGKAADDPNIATTVRRIAEEGSVRKGGWMDPSGTIDPDTSMHMAEATKHGIVGDTALGSHLSGKDRAMVLEMQYGNGLAKPVRQRVARAMGKLAGPAIDMAKKGFTRIPGHRKVKAAYNSVMKRLGFNEDESILELVGKYFTGTEDYEGNVLRREIAELDGLLDDVNTGTRTIPADEVMQLQYEREAKVMALKSSMDDSIKGGLMDAVHGLGYLFGAKSSSGRFGTMQGWSHDFYQRLGNVHKLGVYLYMRKKGVPETVALQRVRTFMQNYNNLPSGIRAIQRSDLASFANPIFSFGYEFWRIQKNIMMHHPEQLAAIWALAPATSFMSMAANGHNVADIWATEAKNEGGFDATTNAIRTLYLPTPDGGYSTNRLTYMDEFAVLGKPTGVLGNLVDNSKAHNQVVYEMAARAAAPFFLENLQTNAAYSIISGRDPLTQKKLEGGSVGVMASAARQVLRMAQPGFVPWSGDSHDLLDTYRRPPRLRTRHMVEASERLMQIWGGLVTRGGFWSQVADGSTGLQISPHVNNLILRSAAIGEKVDLPLRALGAMTDKRMVMGPEADIPAAPLRARGFNDRDLFATLFYANAKFGENYEETGRDGVQNFAQDDMFTAAHLIHEGKQRGDENMVSVGTQIRDGAITRIKERMDAQEQFVQLRELDPEAYEEKVDDVILKAARNASENLEMTYAFNRGSLQQKVITLVEASAMGLDEELVDEGASIMMWTPRMDFNHSMDFNNSAQLRAAMVHLEEHLNNPGRAATGLGLLTLMYQKMSEALPDVIQRDALRVYQDEIESKARDLLDEEVRQ